MSDLKYRYIGGGDYLFNIAPADITVEAWEQLPPTIREAVVAHPKIYEPVAVPAEADHPAPQNAGRGFGPVASAPDSAEPPQG